MNGQGQRKQKGKYYTPQAVVDLCWEVLRAKIAPATLRSFQVVDPAAGDGVFLQEACARGWITGQLATGVELYPGEASRAGVLFRVVKGNGLIDRPEEDFVAGRFDLAVGNPPYGGEGLRDLCRSWEKPPPGRCCGNSFTATICAVFIWGLTCRNNKSSIVGSGGAAGQRALAKLGRCPIELFFLERFICLCREGGWCAVVLPEGLLANERMRSLREWVEERAALLAVVALDRKTFQREGTAARTALVFLRRKPCPVEEDNEKIYFAAPAYEEQAMAATEYLARVGRELGGGEKPVTGRWVERTQVAGNRWDPGFWHPRFRQVLCVLDKAPRLGDFITLLTYGPILPGRRPEPDEGGIPVIGQSYFTEAGLDLSKAIRVAAGSAFDPPRSRVRRGDLLFPRSGEGSLLRFKAGVYDSDQPANVSCFVDLVRLSGIEPYYVWLVLKTRFLREQILRLQNGVGTPNLNFREIRELRIPWQDAAEQAAWRGEYFRRVAPLHLARLQALDPLERSRLGELADAAFRRLVQELEETLNTRYFPRDKSNG